MLRQPILCHWDFEVASCLVDRCIVEFPIHKYSFHSIKFGSGYAISIHCLANIEKKQFLLRKEQLWLLFIILCTFHNEYLVTGGRYPWLVLPSEYNTRFWKAVLVDNDEMGGRWFFHRIRVFRTERKLHLRNKIVYALMQITSLFPRETIHQCFSLVSVTLIESILRADSRLAPEQWGTSLQSNAVSHWLGANPESALILRRIASLVTNVVIHCKAYIILYSSKPFVMW